MTQEQVNEMIRAAVARGREREAVRREYMELAKAMVKLRVTPPPPPRPRDDWVYWQIRG